MASRPGLFRSISGKPRASSWYTVFAVAGIALVFKGTGLFETASERLAIHYELPDVVTGAVVVAIGSSFPELTAAVIAPLLHGDFELGLEALVQAVIKYGEFFGTPSFLWGATGCIEASPGRTNDLVLGLTVT